MKKTLLIPAVFALLISSCNNNTNSYSPTLQHGKYYDIEKFQLINQEITDDNFYCEISKENISYYYYNGVRNTTGELRYFDYFINGNTIWVSDYSEVTDKNYYMFYCYFGDGFLENEFADHNTGKYTKKRYITIQYAQKLGYL